MKTTIAGLAGLILGLSLGVTGSSSATNYVPSFKQSQRACASVTDTICTTYSRRKGGGLVARTYRFVDGNRFCDELLYGRIVAAASTVRCERYWPFDNPVINPQLAGLGVSG